MAYCKTSSRKLFEKLPFDVVDPKENELPKVKLFGKDFVFVGPKRFFQPSLYKTHGLDIYNFEARADDVYIVSFPRSGTTLHTEMAWQIGNNLDFETKDFLMYRVPQIDLSIFRYKQIIGISEKKDASEEAVQISKKYLDLDLKGLSERKGRRFLRSHLPFSLMPPHVFDVGAKVIYCARNPKDVLVSLFHVTDFFKINGLPYDIEDLFEDFKNDLVWCTPYFEHVKEAWEKRNDENVLFLFYEDTIKDKRQTIKKIAEFLDKNLSDEQISSLEDYLNFEKFKNNKSVNNDQLVKLGMAQHGKFIRRGKTGDWRDTFDEETNKELDRLMEQKLKETDLKFPET